MTDPTTEILTAFESTLNGNLTYQGDNWPVYLQQPKDIDAGYVSFSDVNWFDDAGDDTMDVALTMEIVANQPTLGQAKIAPVNSVASSIIGLLAKKTISMTSYFMVVTPYVEDSDMFFDQAPGGILARKILRFRFTCRKNLA